MAVAGMAVSACSLTVSSGITTMMVTVTVMVAMVAATEEDRNE
jgi:hypothetical protein